MRHQSLTGFALHQRRYRERSHILHFFSQEFGRVDGVIRQMPPALYHLAVLQANGKAELKNFSQLDVQGQPFYLQQKALFAGFYLNEILLKLLPLEEAMPQTYQAYVAALEQLKTLPQHDPHDVRLKIVLRQFEGIFLQELGYAIDYQSDYLGEHIEPQNYYAFVPQEGFVRQKSRQGFLGQDLLCLGDAPEDTADFVAIRTKLYRSILNELLGHKPLKSRQLWVTQQQIQHH